MVYNVHWHGHVLRRALDFLIEGERKKWRPERAWRNQVEKESVKVGLRRKDAIFFVECWC